MASLLNGKFFVLNLLLLSVTSSFYHLLVYCNEHELYLEPETRADFIPDQQQIVLQRLEELVMNLSDVVSRLESRLSNSKFDIQCVEGMQSVSNDEKDNKTDSESFGKVSEKESCEDKIRDGDRGRTVSVTKYSPFWSERFQFVSAVKLDSTATCVNVLPFRDYEGLSKYIAVGDEKGRVYVFLRNGDVMVEFYTSSDLPITSLLSYMSAYKNESLVVTGHKDGVILIHKVWEGSNGEEWNSLMMENVGKFVPSEGGIDGSAVTLLEVHHVGRMRYILSSDISGKITVLRENGTAYGSVMPTSKPLAFLKQRLLFLTEIGAGSLDLRSMKVRESECEGLNHSLAQNYVFDATERSKAYGFTSDGDLIHILLLGDIMTFKCRVRSKRKFEMDKPLALHVIKGYLLIVNEEKVFVYNVSSQHYAMVGGPRLVFTAGLDEIRSSFLSYQVVNLDGQRTLIPLVASDHEKLVILGLGGGYVGMYRSNLPLFKGESNTVLWTSPVLLFVIFLFGVWHFFAKKKEALMSWGPEDPFNSTSSTTVAPLGSTTGDRSFPDSSTKSTDIMHLREGGIRGPSRRYGSPTRYPSGATNSFRPNPADPTSRLSSVDPNLRAASELKYRGSNLESTTAFPKRREGLFINSQVGDDSN